MSSTDRNQYLPDTVTAPGELLQEKLEELGMTQADLAVRIGRTKKMINEIVKGKAPILSDTALQLERVLGIPARFWINAEGQYRDYLSRESERARLSQSLDWLTTLPLKKLVQLGWLPAQKDPVRSLQDALNFFGVATLEAIAPQFARDRCLAFRQAATHPIDQYALFAWIRKGELDAQRNHYGAYDAKKFRAGLDKIRTLTTAPVNEYVPKMTELCAEAGVALVFVPEVPGARAWGVTHWPSTDRAIIQLSLRGKTDDQLWFTFFHEAAHILLHPKRSIFVETGDSTDASEKEADRFARDFLIEPSEWRNVLRASPRSAATVKQFAARLGVAPGIIVGRLQREELLPWTHLNGLKAKLAFRPSSVQ